MPAKPRGVLIAGNWKMNHGPKEAQAFFEALNVQSKKHLDVIKSSRVQACVIPPTVVLPSVVIHAGRAEFAVDVCAQNAHWERKGAFTGEISGPMLIETGVHWALIGHSERRQYFGETDETVRKRTESLLEQGFRVIMCIGEVRAERESGQTAAVLTRQLAGALPRAGEGAAKFLDGKLVIAYEPVWAIGTGLTATPEQAEEAHQIIRKSLFERFGSDASKRTQILYGGSVTPENSDSLLACPNVDGLLVGGASLKPESFLALVVSGAKAAGKV